MIECVGCGAQRRCVCEQETDRQRFIRLAAIAFASRDEEPGQQMHSPGRRYSDGECWSMAKALWDSKPEDC